MSAKRQEHGPLFSYHGHVIYHGHGRGLAAFSSRFVSVAPALNRLPIHLCKILKMLFFINLE